MFCTSWLARTDQAGRGSTHRCVWQYRPSPQQGKSLQRSRATSDSEKVTNLGCGLYCRTPPSTERDPCLTLRLTIFGRLEVTLWSSSEKGGVLVALSLLLDDDYHQNNCINKLHVSYWMTYVGFLLLPCESYLLYLCTTLLIFVSRTSWYSCSNPHNALHIAPLPPHKARNILAGKPGLLLGSRVFEGFRES